MKIKDGYPEVGVAVRVEMSAGVEPILLEALHIVQPWVAAYLETVGKTTRHYQWRTLLLGVAIPVSDEDEWEPLDTESVVR